MGEPVPLSGITKWCWEFAKERLAKRFTVSLRKVWGKENEGGGPTASSQPATRPAEQKDNSNVERSTGDTAV